MSYATLPKGSKPSKSTSKDTTRPLLQHAELRETPDGWELAVTDSYQLARVKLFVHDDNGEPLAAGAISLDALKAIEKSGGFRANGTVEPCDAHGRATGQAFVRTDPGKFPDWDDLTPNNGIEPLTIGLDAELLYQLAQSLGAKQHGKCHVQITFCNDDNGNPNPLRPFTVQPLRGDHEAAGLLMPVRVNI